MKERALATAEEEAPASLEVEDRLLPQPSPRRSAERRRRWPYALLALALAVAASLAYWKARAGEEGPK